MAQVYTPTTTLHPTITVPDDGDVATAGSINTQGLKYLADNNSYLKQQVDRKVDGVTGDTYTPSDPIVVRGDGMDIDPLVTQGHNVADELDNAQSFTDIAAINWGELKTSATTPLIFTPDTAQQLLLAGQGADWAVRSATANFWSKTFDGGRTWSTMGDPGIDTRTGMYAPMVWGDLGANGTLVAISTGTSAVLKSTNFGTGWASGGTTTTGLICVGYRKVGTRRFIAAGINKIRTDEDLSGTWTTRAVPSGWASKKPIQIVSGLNELLIIPQFIGGGETPSTVLRSSTGTSWAESSTIPTSGTVTLAGAAWNDFQGKWMISTYQGDVFTSPDGITWSGPFLGPGGRISSLGRVWVVVGSRISITTDGTNWTGVNEFVPSGSSSWQDVLASDGRLIVGAQNTAGINSNLVYQMSLRSPLAL